MLRFVQCAVVCVSLLFASAAIAQKDLVHEVNPMIGTGSGPIGYGGTMPFVTAPFGMTNWTAQTRQNRLSVTSYEYSDSTIQGFMGTHQPAIWMGDFGYVTVMPEIGELKVTPQSRALKFDHAQEVSHPDFYSVDMTTADGKTIQAEMTATERCAYLRFTFPAGVVPRILLEASRPGTDGKAAVNVAAGEITGENPHRIDSNLGPHALPHFRGYFVAQVKQTATGGETYGTGMKSARGGTLVFAKTSAPATIEVRVGTSFQSEDQARANLRAELPAWDFDAARAKLHSTWADKLGKLTIDGATADERTTAYTALYHTLLYPRVFSEGGKYYSAFDDTIHTGDSYTAYSTWDTFRAENSLLTLVAPERVDGLITALLQDFREGGWMPKWPNPGYTNIMIGTHADSMVAEALRKGFRGFDRDLAWKAVYKDAMTPPDGDTTRRWIDREEHTPYEGRAGLTFYKQLGYIPTDKTDEAASRTLEDSYDDWCVAQVAKALGKNEEYRFFLKRSLNDRNLFDSSLHLMRGRTSNGAWAPIGGSDDTDDNRSVSGWTEGDAWVYTWSPFHDIAGVEKLMGGAEAASKQLDQHFAGNHNVHRNEPSHHYGYLYDFTGQPWKTQAKVRELAYKEYANAPAGLDGDDDCGQMSAWYLFAALGMYPVNPASGDYMIGSPMFGRMSLRVRSGKTFTVIADNNGRGNVYIQSATLDGKPLTTPVITWEQMQAGATLRVVMGPQPSTWAAEWRPELPELKM